MPPDAASLLPSALALLGALLAFSTATIAATRQHAMTASLAIALLALIGVFFMSDWNAAIAVLLALIIAAPLLDRTRFPGLLLGALLGMAAIHYTVLYSLPTFLPVGPHALPLLAALAGAGLLGSIGSVFLPIHPAREKLRPPSGPALWRMGGYGLLAGSILSLPSTATPAIMLAALSGALLSLFWARHVRHPQPLLRLGQGLLAGTLAGLLLPENQELALIAGALASILVAHSETLAHGLRIDDPSQVNATLLLPSLLGIVLGSVGSVAQLADHVRWIGAALGLSLLIALVLWPAIMATFGLAAAPRKVREGLDFRD